MDTVEAIKASNGLSIWKLTDGRWQVSTKNKDGSFAVHIGPLKRTLEKALRPFTEEADDVEEDDWRDLI